MYRIIKILTLMLILSLLFTACAAPNKGPMEQENDNASDTVDTDDKVSPIKLPNKSIAVNVATPPSTSAVYAFVIGACNSLEAYAPQYAVTTFETGGAVEEQTMLLRREVDFTMIVSSLCDEQYKGLGTFEGYADPGLRIIFYIAPNIMHWMVNENAGVTRLEDLNGKKFGPSGQGTANEQDTYRIFNLLGIKPDYYVASQGDALTAYQDGRIVGLSKGGDYPESYCVQAFAPGKTKLIGIAQEQAEKVVQEFDYYSSFIIPGGTYNNNPDDVLSIGMLMGLGASVDSDYQLIYDLVMAMYKQDYIWKNAYPTGANKDIFDLTSKSAIYLHSGAVQAFKDLGFNVPEHLIPPEYNK